MYRLWWVGSVLMQLFLWFWAFPLPKQRLQCLASHLGAPSSSFLPEAILLLTTWLWLLWRPYIKQLAGACWGKEESPQPGGERQTPAWPSYG